MSKIGQLVTLSEFSYNGTSDTASLNPKFEFMDKIDVPIHAIITEEFYDYECGNRYIGIIQYKPENLTFEDDVVYFGEFDILKSKKISQVDQINALQLYDQYLLEKMKGPFDFEPQKEMYNRKHTECFSKIVDLVYYVPRN